MSLASIVRNLKCMLLFACAMWQANVVNAQTAYDGFDPPGMSGFPNQVAVQSDGKVLIAGDMQLNNGKIARLLPDGSHDPSFNISSFSTTNVLDLAVRRDGSLLVAGDLSPSSDGGVVALLNSDGSSIFHRIGMASGAVRSIIELPDGKILIAGAFTSVDGQPRSRIARLNADGSLDSSYASSTGANAVITQLLAQPNGKVVIAGEFTLVNGQPHVRVARLNDDGSLDVGFELPVGTNGPIAALALQPDGKIIIGGNFTAAGHATRNRIARLNPDGSVDADFLPGAGPNAAVNDIALQPNGSLLIAGNFLAVDGQPRTRVARLNPDGTLDDRFPPNSVADIEAPRTAGVNSPILGLALQQDSKAVLVGSFNEVDGKPRPGVARLNADGSLDADLEIGPQMNILGWHGGGSASGGIAATTIQPDGKYLISGRFDESHGVPRKGIVRFNADGALDLSFDPGAGPSYPFGEDDVFYVESVALQSDWKVLVGGSFVLFDDVPSPGLVRLAGNGARDAGFAPVLHPSDSLIAHVTHIVPLAEGKTLIGGWIQSEANGGHRKLLRLLPDGSIDPGFTPYDFPATNPWTSYVKALAVQTDGRILLGYEAGDSDGIHLRTMIRLHPDGLLDPSFAELTLDLNVNEAGIERIVPQPDGKIVIVGGFVEIAGEERISIARLNPDGAFDPDFTTAITDGPMISAIALQTDGSLLVGGSPGYIIDGVLTGKVARLNSDGTLDRRFDFTPPIGPFASGGAAQLALDASGKVVMGGYFQWQHPGTQCCDSIARIQTHRSALQSLSIADDWTRVEWLRQGIGPEFTRTSLELSMDGESWIPVVDGSPLLCSGGSCGIRGSLARLNGQKYGVPLQAGRSWNPVFSAIGHVASTWGAGSGADEIKAGQTPSGTTGIPKILISQFYPTEGYAGAAPGAFRHEFIELFNAGDAPQDLTGWSVQYSDGASGNQANWEVIPLTGVTLQPGQYYLIRGAEGTSGTDLPVPDAVSPLPFMNAMGKVAVVNTTTRLSMVCPSNAVAVSLFGTSNTSMACAEGTALIGVLYLPEFSALRGSNGCADSYNNAADFAIASPAVPRNTASDLSPCSSPTGNSIAAIGGTPQSAPANLAFSTSLTVRVTDSDGSPAPGTAVQISAPVSGPGATFPTAVTRANGAGEVAIAATANAEIGSYVVNAQAAGAPASADFQLTNTIEGSPASISPITGTPQTTTTNQAFAEPLTVRVVDANDAPVVNIPIRFEAPASGPRALLSATTVATNGNGEASVAAVANREAGSYEVIATVVGVATPASFALTNAVDPGGSVVISQIYATGGSPDGGSGGPASPYMQNYIELFNAGTAPKSLSGWSLQSTTSVAWNSVALPAATLQPGQYFLVQVRSSGSTGVVLPAPDATGATLRVAPAGGKVALVNGTATLVSECPVGNERVIDFVGYISTTTCAEGAPVAASTLHNDEAALRSGDGCLDTNDNAADFHIGPPQPRNTASPVSVCSRDSIGLVGGTPQNTTVYRPFTAPLTVRVTSLGGNPVPGKVVNFTVPSTGASVTLSTNTATTDANGEASVIATANAIAGSYSVTAGSPGVAGSVTFELTNTGAILEAMAGADQQTAVGEPFHLPLKVRLSDGNGSPIENVEVVFGAPESGASAQLSPTAGTTDANGEVSVLASANALIGSYAVTAEAAGASSSASFALTNIATADVAWAGWFFNDVQLPRNRNVWVRARGFTADGSIHESVKVFYPTGGFTATPVVGEGGRVEPPIPQGGEAGTVLSFMIVPDEGYGIASVTGCNGSLNGSTYLTGPLSVDCEIEAVFAGDVETFTVTASAGPGGSIEPEGTQPVTEGETVSFVLLPEPGHVIAGVDGTCGGELVEDIFTTLPVTSDCSVQVSFEPEPVDDVLFADGFEGEAR